MRLHSSFYALRNTLLMSAALLVIAGCSSRGVVSDFDGSTGQRLLTYSIDGLTKKLPDSDFSDLRDKKGYYESSFIEAYKTQLYADKRMKRALNEKFGIKWIDTREDADFVMDVYWTSLGTNQDVFGLTIPLGVVPGVAEGTRLDIFALDMYHGISEAYYFVENREAGTLKRSKNFKAVVRTDSLALPFITLPVNTLPDDQ